jgi:hypothetical protein
VQTPTPDQLRTDSDLLAAKYPASGPNDAKLSARAATAAALVAGITFRLIEPITSSTVEGYEFEEVPAGLVPVAVHAVATMVERMVVTGAPDFAEQAATGRRLRGFSAGPYSEQYFAPGEFARRGAAQGRPPMDADDALDAALWALATEDAREAFVAWATGVQPPAGAVSSFDYRRQGGGYGTPRQRFGFIGGPDGV